MSAALSTSGEEAITRTIHLELDEEVEQLQHDFHEFYEIQRTADEIVTGDYKRIALQFPDELLHDSVPIYQALKGKLGDGRDLYVLADTSYGSCCVDEVAAQHVDADAMVHYGHACMSQTSRLPVVYVFGRKPLEPTDCVRKLLESLYSSGAETKTLLLRHDVAYTYQSDSVVKFLRESLPSHFQILYSPVPLTSTPSQVSQTSTAEITPHHQANDTPAEDCTILYIGGESLSLTNLLMTHASSPIHSYDPKTKTARLETARANKLLMRRYAVVQKARDADVFGILVGTLGVAAYLPLISYLRTLIRRARKKSYTISVGKLNPAKLANFMEIECFVLVACPENSVVEAKEFLRPIVTPYELEVALKAEQSWTGRYVLNFEKLLQEAETEAETETVEDTEEDHDPDRPHFSLVTGTYRHAKRYGADSSDDLGADPSAVILRNQDGAVIKATNSAAGQFLQSRTFKGLETRVGQDAPGVLEQGRGGIAREYRDDHRETA